MEDLAATSLIITGTPDCRVVGRKFLWPVIQGSYRICLEHRDRLSE